MKRTLADLEDSFLKGKRALVRVDFNVPLDATSGIGDDTRIRAALPTIAYLADRGARVVLLSHLGRPRGGPELKYSMAPVARHLATLTSRIVRFEGSSAGDAADPASKA
jgi:phosphoglycerate kinase